MDNPTSAEALDARVDGLAPAVKDATQAVFNASTIMWAHDLLEHAARTGGHVEDRAIVALMDTGPLDPAIDLVSAASGITRPTDEDAEPKATEDAEAIAKFAHRLKIAAALAIAEVMAEVEAERPGWLDAHTAKIEAERAEGGS